MKKELITYCEFCTARKYCKNYKLLDVHVVMDGILKCLDVDMEMYEYLKKKGELCP